MLILRHEGKNYMAPPPTVTGLQLRAARLGRGRKQGEMAKAAKVSRATVQAIEADREVREVNRDAVIKAYEDLGVCFGFAADGSPTVVFLRDVADSPRVEEDEPPAGVDGDGGL